MLLGEALEDDLLEPGLLHRRQHDLGDLLQGGEIPDHALVSFRQVLHLLIGEGIFNGVDDDAGHGEEQLAVFRVEGQVFAVGVEFVIHPQGAGQLPLEGERHRQAVMDVARRIRRFPFIIGRFGGTGAGGYSGQGRAFRGNLPIAG